MKTYILLNSEEQSSESKFEYRQWKDVHPSPLLHTSKGTAQRIKKHHQTRWNRLRKMTLPNSLIVLMKHKILALGTFAGALVSISLLLPSLYEQRYLLAMGLTLVVSLLPSLLKVATRFLFTKSWSYRHCVTPFVFIACAFSALPGFLLLKKGASQELITIIESQQLPNPDKNSPLTPEDNSPEKQTNIDSIIAQLQ